MVASNCSVVPLRLRGNNWDERVRGILWEGYVLLSSHSACLAELRAPSGARGALAVLDVVHC